MSVLVTVYGPVIHTYMEFGSSDVVFCIGDQLALEGDLFPILLSSWSGLSAMGIFFLFFVVWGSRWFFFPLFWVQIPVPSLLFFFSLWFILEKKWIVFFLFLGFQVLGSMNYINNLVSLILLFTVISLTLWIVFLLDFLSFILLSLYVGGVLILFLTVIKLLGVEKRDLFSFSWVPLFFWTGIFVIFLVSFGDRWELFYWGLDAGLYPFLTLTLDYLSTFLPTWWNW